MAIPRIAPSDARSAVEALLGRVKTHRTVGSGQNSAIAAVLDTEQGRVHRTVEPARTVVPL